MHEPACMHAAAAAIGGACMDHGWTGGKTVATAGMHACVRGCLRDRHHVSADLHVGADPGVGNRISIFEFSYKYIRDYYARSKGRVRGTVPRARPFNSA